MTIMKTLTFAALLAAGSIACAAPTAAPPAKSAPDAAHVKVVQDLMAAMQTEKMMRLKAGLARYGSDTQRQAVMAKLEKVSAPEVHSRLAVPVARLLDSETAVEMTRYYAGSYGQKLLKQAYNSGPSLYQGPPAATAAEKAEMKKPAMAKALAAFGKVEAKIEHEAFVLLTQIAK